MLNASNTGYSEGSQGSTSRSDDTGHAELKKQYMEYLDQKTEEIAEQKNSRRYYHGAHWTDKQVKALNQRKQPIVTYNRVGRKINAIVGLLDRQKQDPRGFPRTPQHEEGAELATAVLRYVLDQQDWETISPDVGLDGAVDGIGGVELNMEQGDEGDPEVALEKVDPGSFFYDPRSIKPDFSDARFMGMGKWSDLETAIETFPDKEEELRGSLESGSDLTSNPDSDDKWVMGNSMNRRLRLVDHWYKKGGQWHWCVYTGSVKLASGVSPFKDEKGKTFCKYIMFSANVDHDGDRYGFVRNMRSAQDEINQRRSKGLHQINSRRIIIPTGTGANIEKIRKESARPDGVIEYPMGSEAPQFDDAAKSAELAGQLSFLQDAKDEIENYGFNPALIGTGVGQMSGRAMKMQQQAGIAELGPYLLAYRGWKFRVYRAIWNVVQQFWTSERWIRVTDDENVAQFLGINQLQVDPNTGMPVMTNQLGSLDVDIIIDESPDTVNMQADAYDTMGKMSDRGADIPAELLIELSPLHGSKKKRLLEILKEQSSNPAKEAAQQIEIATAQAEMQEIQASAALKQAQAEKIMSEIGQNMDNQGQSQNDSGEAQLRAMTDIEIANIKADTAIETTYIKAESDMELTALKSALEPAQESRHL